MSRFFIPTHGPDDWKWLIAEPGKQWKDNHSAKLLAESWEDAQDFPKSVRSVFRNSGITLFDNVELLLAFPEYKVSLPGGKRASQNDIFILAKGNDQLISIAVEGKALESFDKPIEEWRKDNRGGKGERLKFLCSKLQLDRTQIGHVRYQLLHRTASAILLAETFNAKNALMLVHCFARNDEGFDDYSQFLQLFGKKGERDSLTSAKVISGRKLFFGWVSETRL